MVSTPSKISVINGMEIITKIPQFDVAVRYDLIAPARWRCLFEGWGA